MLEIIEKLLRLVVGEAWLLNAGLPFISFNVSFFSFFFFSSKIFFLTPSIKNQRNTSLSHLGNRTVVDFGFGFGLNPQKKFLYVGWSKLLNLSLCQKIFHNFFPITFYIFLKIFCPKKSVR